MVLLRLSYCGDAGSILGAVPLCVSDDDNVICEDGSGAADHRKSASGVLYF